MANPLDMVTEDQSQQPDVFDVPRLQVYRGGGTQGEAALSPDNKLVQAVAPEPPNDLMAGIAALKDYLLNGQFSPGTKVGNRLFGTGGEERQQLWPERMLRSGVTLPGDVASGAEPMLPPGLRREDFTDAPAPGGLTVTAQPGDTVRERTQDLAGLAGGSALAERPGAGTLGSGPLRPGAKAMPVEPAPVFYSALEHAATNATQETMSPQQWLGYLKNQPGVKQEELQWTGIGDWLGQQKGKVKKEDVQQYLDGHKVEIKDVTKSGRNATDEVSNDLHDSAVQAVLDAFLEQNPKWESKTHTAAFERAHENFANGPEGERIWNDVMQSGMEPPGSTKYSSYQLPGGENYREHLLTMPEKTGDGLAGWDKITAGSQNYRSSHWDEPNVLAHVRTNDRVMPGETPKPITDAEARAWAKKHVDEAMPEPMWDRLTPEKQAPWIKQIKEKAAGPKPMKSLHIEEIQSDWHQQGRKQGYATSDLELKQKAEQARKDYRDSLPVVHTMIENNNNFGYRDMPEAMRKMRDQGPDVAFPNMTEEQGRIAWKAYDAFNDANSLAKQVKGGVPDAPFKTTWPELALKRMIRHAAENGYDRISWTPGEAQAARYDLSKQIERLAYDPESNRLVGFAKGNKGNTPQIDKKVTPDKLADEIGKEAADKILNSPSSKGKLPMFPGEYNHLGNADLKVGGEGMREFYDKMLPKMAEKIGKAHGVKVKTTEPVSGGKEQLSKNILSHPNLSTILDEMQYNHPTRAGWSEAKAHKFLKDLAQKDPEKFVKEYEKITGNYDDPHMKISSMDDVVPALHYFDLPQSLKDHAIGRGFPLYMSSIPFPLTPVDHDPFEKKKK